MPDVPIIVITATKADSKMTKENVEDWSLAHQSLGKGVTHKSRIFLRKKYKGST